MKNWPKKDEREKLEIDGFIEAYKELINGRRLIVESKREKPDYFLKDPLTDEIIGVELTSVYLSDRSVPDEHMKVRPTGTEIPYEPQAIEDYKERILEKIEEKVQKAQKGYDTTHRLILAIYPNEYLVIHIDPEDWARFVEENNCFFDNISPFSEVVLWSLQNNKAISILPGSKPSP